MAPTRQVNLSLSACIPGLFGPNCNQVCQCSETNQLCHPVSGSCYCAPGFHGSKCDQSKRSNELKDTESCIIKCNFHTQHSNRVECFQAVKRVAMVPTVRKSVGVKTEEGVSLQLEAVNVQLGSLARAATSVSSYQTLIKIHCKYSYFHKVLFCCCLAQVSLE